MPRFILAWTSHPTLLGAAVGALGFLRYQKLEIIVPTNVQAFIAGDWGTHMLGWLHFRNAPLWQVPLGQVPNLGYPHGTSLLFTDAIPLLGLAFRPFSALLPTDFQYVGLWLLASFVLQGALGARIAAIYLRSHIAITASAALFVLMPAFVLRNVHPALTAHWILLAVLDGGLRGPRGTRWGLVTIVSLTTLIQPYLWAFALILILGVLFDDVRRGACTWPRAAASGAACIASSLGLLALIGAFTPGFQTTLGGFGSYSANALTFIAPNGTSRFLRLDTPITQMEGFAYLGLGVLALLGIVLVVWLRGRRFPERAASPGDAKLPLGTGVAALVLAAFALSDHIFVGRYEVLTLAWIYDPIRPFAAKFRCSGRAIWPLMYLLVAFAIGGLRRLLGRSVRRPERTAAIVLTICAGVQLVDPAVTNRYDEIAHYFFDKSGPYFVDRLSDPRWKLINTGGYRHMAVVPTTTWGCEGVSIEEGWYSGRIALLSLEAYRANLTFNSGYFSRWQNNVAENCAAQNKAASARLAAASVYIFGEGHHPPDGSRCDLLNGINVCVLAQNEDQFARSLVP